MYSRILGYPAAKRHNGLVAIQVALWLVVLLGFAALAVDIGRALVVRNELQNAADAAALAGAGKLSGALTVSSSSASWNTADAAVSAAASSATGNNDADGRTLATAQVQTGYWNVTGTPAGLQSTAITPGTYDKPAVAVTISLSTGNNGGPLALIFAPVLGISTMPVSATAVAAISAPGHADPGSLFPFVIPQCLLQESSYWNATTGQPVSVEVTLYSTYHSSDHCLAGQWTSFPIYQNGSIVQNDANNVPTVRSEIQNGNSTPLQIGDSTWIEPGTKATLYGGTPTNVDVVLPVVAPVAGTDITTHASQPIVGFVAFHIDNVSQPQKYIQGHFLGGLKAKGTSVGNGAGPYYGAYTPPSLVH